MNEHPAVSTGAGASRSKVIAPLPSSPPTTPESDGGPHGEPPAITPGEVTPRDAVPPARPTSGPPPPSQPAQPGANGEPSPLHDYLAFFRGRTVVMFVVLLLIIFSLLTLLVLRGDLQPTTWDISITHEIQELPDVPVGVLLVAVSQPGFQPWNWIIVIALMALFFAAFRRPVEAIFVGLAGLGAALSEVVKNLVDRPRPTPDFAHILGTLHSYSFPSGHVTGYTILFGFLFYLVYTHMPRGRPIRTGLLIFFILMIVLVGPSRVYMGQHWASDALAGYTLGFAYLLLLIEVYRFWLKRNATRNA